MKQEHFKKLMEGPESFSRWRDREIDSDTEIDLSGADLIGIDLSGVNLYASNLDGANLSHANLSSANLSGSCLREAKLKGTKMSGANLSGTVLSGADVRTADLRLANLFAVNLGKACLSASDLSGASLSSANLCSADLTRVNLSRVNLSYADLLQANLSGSDLSDADLFETDLRGANLSDTNLNGADLSEAIVGTNAKLHQGGVKDSRIIFMISILAECANDADSIIILRNLRQALSVWVTSHSYPPHPYWKMPELYDFTFDLKPTCMEKFSAIIKSVSSGWNEANDDETSELDRTAVWNRRAGNILLVPEVTWACLRRYHQYPNIDDELRAELSRLDLQLVNLNGAIVNENTKFPADYESYHLR